MKRSISIAILFCILNLPGIAQVESGSIVVLSSSKDEIAVAADSRSRNVKDYVDNRCKISALGNELIFAATGKTRRGPLGGAHPSWDVHAIAHDEYRKLVQEQTQHLPLTLANRWGREVEKQLRLDLISHRESTLSGVTDSVLTRAIVAAFTAEGMSIVAGQITYGFTGQGEPFTNFTVTNTSDKPTSVFVGDTEIADEFRANVTARAIQWRQAASTEAAKAQDRVAFLAIHLVKLTIEEYSGKMIDGTVVPAVGGPVDALRLVRGQGIEWIQRKENCPAD